MVVEKLHGLGGAQMQALRLANALARQSISVRIVTGRWRWSEPSRTEIDGVPVLGLFTAFKFFHLKGLRKLGMYIYLASLFLHLWLKRRSYDVIHVHSATVSAFAVALAGKWLGKPTIMKVMASGGWGDLKRMQAGGEVPGSAAMSRRFRRIDRVVCLNQEAEAECRDFGFSEEQLFRVPNGFPVRDVEPRTSYENASFVVVTYAGRLDAQKNPRMLIDAIELLARSGEASSLELNLLGDGPERSEIEQMVLDRGLGGLIHLHGRVKDVPAHLAKTDIFVLPSLSEGISNALLEAMAHGLACIATSIPGNVDLIEDGETGLLVEPGDVKGLAGAIRELAVNVGLRERLGRGARRHVEEHFDMETIASRYAALYRELAGPRVRQGRPDTVER